ncbi:MAG: acyl-CoA/acyl-ACP dehydrogenase [Polyangiaceae bacterium]|nr:acyl-CoA/acyl-ACP dehydrogenase [Polyangiaceae bacterium]MCE7888953.1 acyl-CoA dehydrogenase [Sorangiineae bacterium PRO1]MCL4748804.1 acyl-CoA/acyl-ACP dehydrogenase [Myxococcales bacterium]
MTEEPAEKSVAPHTLRGDDLEPAIAALGVLYARAKERVLGHVTEAGRISSRLLDRHQLAAHALAYLATEVEAARQLVAWSDRVGGDLERRIAGTYVGELCRQLVGGIDLGACESISLGQLWLEHDDVRETLGSPSVQALAERYGSGDAVCELARLAHEHNSFGSFGLDDETLSAIQSEFRRFVEREVLPIAQDVHRRDVLIPMDLIAKMAELGVFGLTIPEEYGGQGLGKVAMCLVTEELSRGYIGVGSLGTRSEIAAELILGGGTDEQKRDWLPRLAAGEVLSTAVFTEPNFGSDLAHIKARAEKQPDGSYQVFGQKTWITHATRADLMTLLVRTNPEDGGYGGLSMFLAPKTRGSETDIEAGGFPDPGITGTEIRVLGYRGMKEFEIGFDGFVIPPGCLLGEVEGQGFKQLMVTFESARIQTAARGVGVAQAALDEAMRYAHERVQFGVPIFSFPRVQRKLGRMIARIMATRQLTFFAARAKDSGKRCDLEAGMAKLLATRAAWEAADACVQIHGGNGYAEEYVASRLLVDARVLSIFEGANEIQAHVIARRLLEV